MTQRLHFQYISVSELCLFSKATHQDEKSGQEPLTVHILTKSQDLLSYLWIQPTTFQKGHDLTLQMQFTVSSPYLSWQLCYYRYESSFFTDTGSLMESEPILVANNLN